jgi:hypothetical protein
MSSEATVVYEFLVLADRGSTPSGVVSKAWGIARGFYGSDDFELTVNVSARPGKDLWDVSASASGILEAS